MSDKAFELYLKKKGIKYFKKKSEFGQELFGSTYTKCTKEEYDALVKKSMEETGNYKQVNDTGVYLSVYDVKRDDPALVEVVKELKKKAGGMCADLKIVTVPDGVEWEITEYDGLEKVEEVHRSWN